MKYRSSSFRAAIKISTSENPEAFVADHIICQMPIPWNWDKFGKDHQFMYWQNRKFSILSMLVAQLASHEVEEFHEVMARTDVLSVNVIMGEALSEAIPQVSFGKNNDKIKFV